MSQTQNETDNVLSRFLVKYRSYRKATETTALSFKAGKDDCYSYQDIEGNFSSGSSSSVLLEKAQTFHSTVNTSASPPCALTFPLPPPAPPLSVSPA